MKLVEPQQEHLLKIMSWFSSEQELNLWSGPNFRYPYNLSSFTEDLKLDQLHSFSLVTAENEFCAFGQYYLRLGKCHLGRLIVNPESRGQGIASQLMHRLCDAGLAQLKVKACSLFVLADNEKAIKAYEKFGFAFTDYPEEITLENCLYMVKP
ncbi:GNAT family N-acetyltransferase [Thalassomonas actiniarum]|uniref:GNAT family N-acetyltransferase n=1 Tax=Thalassomonas actiniarum TaxID=485447 RepID=A0AAE9YR27_9GAMM|nr:GNAT family N-acetyltransferase [Thalassomonas actiniarum]WDD99301.1 GNAT family N-acetyltransferase [Thalassomonas actiniarum]